MQINLESRSFPGCQLQPRGLIHRQSVSENQNINSRELVETEQQSFVKNISFWHWT